MVLGRPFYDYDSFGVPILGGARHLTAGENEPSASAAATQRLEGGPPGPGAHACFFFFGGGGFGPGEVFCLFVFVVVVCFPRMLRFCLQSSWI